MTKFTDLRGASLAPIHLGSVLEAGGKPSTWFPPEGLVELTCNARGFQMLSDDFLMEKFKFSKKLQKCHISQILSKFGWCLNHAIANVN